MARTKDQAARRQQLVHATIELIADDGIEALTLAAIADHVGVSHRLVAYYYAGLESLVQEAYEAAVERYYWGRLRTLGQAAEPEAGGRPAGPEAGGRPAGPEARLLQLMRSGLPGPQDRRLSQVLNEMSVSASRDGVHAALMARLFQREVSLYLSVLEDGQASGSFRLSQPALTVARNLVALEDAYGFHLLAKTSPVDEAMALDALTGYARTATGASLVSRV